MISKKALLTASLAGTFTILALNPVFASEKKIIILEDGSTLNGSVVAMRDGKYIIETSNLGQIEIAEDKIESILSETAARLRRAREQESSQGSTASPQSGALFSQVTTIQNKLANDPQMMEGISQLMKDPAIQQLMSNPNLMNDVMSFDQDRLMNNPQVQELLKNPQIQQMMQQIMGTMQTQ